jgi:excinuclease ABC subunit C
MGAELALDLDLSVPVFGMVKDDRHRTRALVDKDGNEIAILARPDVFSFIGRIQEETHRFAIEFHRSLRGKESTKSIFDEIRGVGAKRRDALYKRFKSVQGIKSATIEELSEVVPKNVAEQIHLAISN